jgi:hypothetical protein
MKMMAERNGFRVETTAYNDGWKTVVSNDGVQLAVTVYRTAELAVVGHAKRVQAWIDSVDSIEAESNG